MRINELYLTNEATAPLSTLLGTGFVIKRSVPDSIAVCRILVCAYAVRHSMGVPG